MSTMLKLQTDAAEAGLNCTPQELIDESCTAHNVLLQSEGVIPAAGVFGFMPKDLFDVANNSPDVPYNTEDAADRALLLRVHAKTATLRAVAEDRVAKLSHTKVEQTQTQDLRVGDAVDIWRARAVRDTPSWRGPGVLLELNPDHGTGIVRWQGRPWTMSLRHMRRNTLTPALLATKNVFYHKKETPTARNLNLVPDHEIYNHFKVNASPDEQGVEALFTLMDMADSAILKTLGLILSHENVMTPVPPNAALREHVLDLARRVSDSFFGGYNIDGIRIGTQDRVP